jgi:hypothetical protein
LFNDWFLVVAKPHYTAPAVGNGKVGIRKDHFAQYFLELVLYGFGLTEIGSSLALEVKVSCPTK